jgi:thiamine biosynthesis lipoprotein
MTAVTTWNDWSCTVSVAVPDGSDLAEARRAVASEMAAMDAAASRFRPDSELSAVNRAPGRAHRLSPLLAGAVRTALDAARLTAGMVDPTLGGELVALGYDRDIDDLRRTQRRPVTTEGRVGTRPGRRPTWQDVRLAGRLLTVPEGVSLDLGATAKALTADRAAAAVGRVTGGPALVSVGGDLAAVGGIGWDVLLAETPEEATAEGLRTYDGGLATSSTLARRWTVDGTERHHLVDPRTGRPVDGPWRTVTVAARTCVAANTASTAALVLGADAAAWLEARALPARLVARDGGVLRVGGWTGEAA